MRVALQLLVDPIEDRHLQAQVSHARALTRTHRRARARTHSHSHVSTHTGARAHRSHACAQRRHCHAARTRRWNFSGKFLVDKAGNVQVTLSAAPRATRPPSLQSSGSAPPHRTALCTTPVTSAGRGGPDGGDRQGLLTRPATAAPHHADRRCAGIVPSACSEMEPTRTQPSSPHDGNIVSLARGRCCPSPPYSVVPLSV